MKAIKEGQLRGPKRVRKERKNLGFKKKSARLLETAGACFCCQEESQNADTQYRKLGSAQMSTRDDATVRRKKKMTSL